MKRYLILFLLVIIAVFGILNKPDNIRLSALLTNTSVPYPPYNLNSTLSSYNSNLMTWTNDPVNTINSISVDEYKIYKRESYTGTWTFLTSVKENAYTDKMVPGSFDYQVKACNTNGCSANTDWIIVTLTKDVVAPSVPGQFSVPVKEITDSQVNLYWSASTDDVGMFAYNIYRSPITTNNFSLIGSVSASQLTYSDKTPQPISSYYYIVKAVDFAKNESPPTLSINVITPALGTAGSYIRVVSPNGGECYTLPSNLPITWTGSSLNKTNVYFGGRSGNPIFTGNGTNFDWYMTGSVSATTEGAVWVVAVDELGNEGLADTNDKPFTISYNCNKETPVPVSIPEIPTYMRAKLVPEKINIDLSWQDNSKNESEFRIYRRALPSGNWAMIGKAGSNFPSFTDTNVPPGDYEYDVSACNSSGCSIYSNTYKITAVATLPEEGKIYSESELKAGDMVSAAGSDDPDVYIVNEHGFKRLFLNEAIFNFYGHLGGFQNIKKVSGDTRDNFDTSGLFRNCETQDEKIYGVEVTGEDVGQLHWVNTSGEQAVTDDPDFFNKVFCINNNEFNWYQKGAAYTSVKEIPEYNR